MTAVVGVHGIAQHRTQEAVLQDRWNDGFARGLRLARQAPDVPVIDVAYYGYLWSRDDETLGAQIPGVLSDDDVAFLESAAQEADIRLDEEDDTLGLPPIDPRLSRVAQAIDKRWGKGAHRLAFGSLLQARDYLADESIREEVDARVLERISGETRVLVGHSLGSLVVFHLSCNGRIPPDTGIVTIGSPLNWPTVRRAVDTLVQSTTPAHVWVNVFNELDVVTGGHGLVPELAPTVELPIWARDDPHGISTYLGSPVVANEIYLLAVGGN